MVTPAGAAPSAPEARCGTMGREVTPSPWASGCRQLPAPGLAELDGYPRASVSVGSRNCVSGRAVLHEASTLSLETLRRMPLFLLFTRMCVTEVWCPFSTHTGFFEKRGFHRRMRGS